MVLYIRQSPSKDVTNYRAIKTIAEKPIHEMVADKTNSISYQSFRMFVYRDWSLTTKVHVLRAR